MEDRRPEIKKFIEDHKNELMISITEIVRLIDYDEDEDDCYYKVLSLRNGVLCESCVGALYPLKGIIPNEQYEAIDRIFDLNINNSLFKQQAQATLAGAQNFNIEMLLVKKTEKVFVNWDPLYENVICVHKTEEGVCPECEEIIKQRYKERCYHVAGDWFEIKE